VKLGAVGNLGQKSGRAKMKKKYKYPPNNRITVLRHFNIIIIILAVDAAH
jgi:hypothetical protein